MENVTEKLFLLRVDERGVHEIEDIIVKEFSLTIAINNREMVTLLCSPMKLEYLAAGYLLSERLIKERDDIKKISLDVERGMVQLEIEGVIDFPLGHVIASGGGKSTTSSNNVQRVSAATHLKLSAARVFSLMEDFIQRSEVFRNTGGVHSAALCNTDSIMVFSEDIGRHNAIDKVFGECLLENIAIDDRIVITSGRISSEISRVFRA